MIIRLTELLFFVFMQSPSSQLWNLYYMHIMILTQHL